MVNEYVKRNLFGFETSILDSSYVVCNLYWRKLEQSTRLAAGHQGAQARSRSTPPSGAAQEDNDSTRSIPNAGATDAVAVVAAPSPSALCHVLLPFLQSVLAMEQLPVLDGDGLAPQSGPQRAARLRFLRDVYAAPLPIVAQNLLQAIDRANQACRTVFESVSGGKGDGSAGGGAAVDCVLPSRAQQVELQNRTRAMLRAVKDAKSELEEALNAMAASDGDATAESVSEEGDATSSTAVLYPVCEELYEDWLVPRMAVAEILCATRNGLCLRTAEGVEFAFRTLRNQGFGGPDFFAQLWRRADEDEASRIGVFLSSSASPSSHTAPAVSTVVPDAVYQAILSRRSTPNEKPDDKNLRSSVGLFLTDLTMSALRMLYCLTTEIRAADILRLDSLFWMRELLQLATDQSTEHHASEMEQRRATALRALARCRISDADAWESGLAHRTPRPLGQPPASSTEEEGGVGFSALGRGTSELRTSGDKHYHSAHQSVVADDPSDEDRRRSRGLASHSLATVTDLMRALEAACRDDDSDEGFDSSKMDTGNEDDARASRLYSILGQVNLFLKRTGLAAEVKEAREGGKVVPTSALPAADGGGGGGGGGSVSHRPSLSSNSSTSQRPPLLSPAASCDVFLPHRVDERLGFGRDNSVLYERACLLHSEFVQRAEVAREFSELADATDEVFLLRCHEDLLESLFERADEHCFLGRTRQIVSERRQQTFIVRVKLSHYDGSVRVLTLPQTASLSEVLEAFAVYWPNLAQRCTLCYLDDDDRVTLSSDREYRDVLKHRRARAMESVFQRLSSTSSAPWLGSSTGEVTGYSGSVFRGRAHNGASLATLGGSQSTRALLVAATLSDALKIELFADEKKQDPSIRSSESPRAANGGPAPPLPPRGSSESLLTTSSAVRARADLLSRPSPVGAPATAERPRVDRLPAGVSLNDAIRAAEVAVGHVDGEMEALRKFYERKALQMGVPLSSVAPPPPSPPRGAAMAPACAVAGPPPLQRPHGATDATGTPVVTNVAARAAFLAMQRSPSTKSDRSLATGEQSGAAQVALQEASSSVVVIRPSEAPRWGVPPATGGRGGARTAAVAYGQLSIAQHVLTPSDIPGSRERPDEDDLDAAVPVRGVALGNVNGGRRRGDSNISNANVSSGTGVVLSAPLAGALRHNGPVRRSGVPLPPAATPPSKQSLQPSERKQ